MRQNRDMDDRSKKGETPKQMLIVNDLTRNIKSNKAVTCYWFSPFAAPARMLAS